jgi:hypothetical protein
LCTLPTTNVWHSVKSKTSTCTAIDWGALYNIIESDVYLEAVDENKNLCQPKEKYFSPNCVGPRECPDPGVCYRFETEQQDYECDGYESAG